MLCFIRHITYLAIMRYVAYCPLPVVPNLILVLGLTDAYP